MAFDFAIFGDGKFDSLAFGINTTKVFSLEAKYAANGEFSTSPLIDVSAYAGSTNELFFGIMGGTSTNCEVQIEGIRFYTLATPTLAVTQSNGITQLSWPSTANGYVLETAENLGPPTGWLCPTCRRFGPEATSSPHTWSEPTRFFRLRQH